MTTQETAIYAALTTGDHDTIDTMHQQATTEPYTPPDPTPADWNPGPEQWDEDYGNAYEHYQADHEPSEAEREQATAEHVATENT